MFKVIRSNKTLLNLYQLATQKTSNHARTYESYFKSFTSLEEKYQNQYLNELELNKAGYNVGFYQSSILNDVQKLFNHLEELITISQNSYEQLLSLQKKVKGKAAEMRNLKEAILINDDPQLFKFNSRFAWMIEDYNDLSSMIQEQLSIIDEATTLLENEQQKIDPHQYSEALQKGSATVLDMVHCWPDENKPNQAMDSILGRLTEKTGENSFLNGILKGIAEKNGLTLINDSSPGYRCSYTGPNVNVH